MHDSAPSPTQVLETALELMGLAIGRVQPHQRIQATPCPDWNVSHLINHNIKNLVFATGVLDGSDGPNPMNVSGPLPVDGSGGDEAARYFSDAADGFLSAVTDLGLGREVVTPFGPMKAEEFLLIQQPTW